VKQTIHSDQTTIDESIPLNKLFFVQMDELGHSNHLLDV
jgi:hypothetical protein